MAIVMPLVQVWWLLSLVVTPSWWSFWALVGALVILEIGGQFMEGNGHDASINASMRSDPKVLQAVNILQKEAPNLAGVVIVGIGRDGNAFNLAVPPGDPRMMRVLQGQMFEALLALNDLVRTMQQEVPASPIIRPPMYMRGG